MSVFGSIKRWGNKPGRRSRWQIMKTQSVTGLPFATLLIVLPLTWLQRIGYGAIAALVLAAGWAVLFSLVDSRVDRKNAAQQLSGTWAHFVAKSDLIGGEIEICGPDLTLRGPIRYVEREGDQIVFDRHYLAYNLGLGWEHYEAVNGTEFKVSALLKTPSQREDGTFFLLVPEIGSVIIYPKDHLGLLKLTKNVTLEPAQTTTV